MPSVEELQDTIEVALTHAAVDAVTIERNPGSTIVPEEHQADSAGRRALSQLTATEEEKLELHDTIGEGGMGIVRLATQRRLGREVAVKTLKPEHSSERSTLELLREAWVTGGLEHPNVVPVYDIALGSDARPLVVLKRIVGDQWASLMHDAEAVRQRFGADDLLGYNLQILLQVCNAIRFAHSRGILHRDLKPENVMIGPFGEVYLVDWGIAVSLRDDVAEHIPRASEATEMAGTPLYMAPEMLGSTDESRLSERTDVYLLGAILYEIICGHPPHHGESLKAIVASILESPPKLPEEVPVELRRIVEGAMAADPDDRFDSAEGVRLAVQSYLEHRDAARLAARAGERLRELEALLEAHAGGHDDPDAREPIYHLFGECRFGFRQALEVWPEHDAARRALERAIGAMVDYELGQGEPEAARALLSEMRAPSSELATRVEEARKRRRHEEAEAERLRADLDPAAGRRTRAFLAIVLGSVWTISPLVSHVLVHREGWAPDPWWGVEVGAVYLAAAVALGVWARESMMRTRINRQVGAAVLLGILTVILVNLRAALAGASPWSGISHALLVWAAIAASLAVSVDRRLAVSAACYLAGFLSLAWLGPTYGFLAMSVTNFVLLLNAAVLWARPNEDLEAARQGVARRRKQGRHWLRARIGQGDEIAEASGGDGEREREAPRG